MTDINDHFFIKRIREIRDQLPGPLAAQAEREAITLVEQSEALREENEKLKTYADVNWLKRELDALTARVAHLEFAERTYGK